jgi:hypothetical protein
MNLRNLEPLALTKLWSKRKHRVRLGEQHTQDSNLQHNHAHKSRFELKTQHTEFATQVELKSLTQRIKCVEAESGCLCMLRECLVYSPMRLGVPFIAPRQLGAIGDQHGRLSLPSIEWRTGQSGAPLDRSFSLSGVWSPSISGAVDHCSSGLVGTPDTNRCTPDSPVHPADHWSEPRVVRWSRGRPLALPLLVHRTVRYTTGQSSEF